ncbi:MAG TPA: response regulator [Gammaproteobacteria bacterium]|nr:response regulator [Gammaproteobacteria bacterium]
MAKKQASIMVVDGSGVSRTLITRILRIEMGNAQITACASAQQALSYLDSAKYDLITTSLLLPDMDGLDLCRAIRQSNTHRFTPIIVVSGDANDRLLREGFAAGVTDYFDKSRGYAEFVEFVKALTLRNLGVVGRVLYVEDSPTAAEITRRIMEKHGLQVLHVTTGEQALDLLQGNIIDEDERQIDIVVTDFFLEGGMTGGDLLHAIRVNHHFSLQEMPVLIITAESNIKKQIELIHRGANDFVGKPLVEEILMARLRSLLLVKQQHKALLRQAEEMKRLATTDSLTGVRSKRYLLDSGERFVADKDNQPIWAMLIDIDHFKNINANRGYFSGDHILIRLGALLRKHFAGDAVVVRFGGEEFAVLLPRCSRVEAHGKAEALRQSIEVLRPMDIPVTISIGIAATIDYPALNLTQLLALADQALHGAKAAGRNRVFTISPQGGVRGLADVTDEQAAISV